MHLPYGTMINNLCYSGRDSHGIKPLYYSDNGQSIRFASQVKALLKSTYINQDVEPAGHVGFYLFGHVPDPYTLYRGIHALPAGSYLWINGNGAQKPVTHFSIHNLYANAEKNATTIVTSAERHTQLKAALKETIAHHLIADVPVGVFLSAGLDSATITGFASACVSTPLHTMTLGFSAYRQTPEDEVPLAETIARHYQTDHQTRWLTRESTAGEFEKLMAAMDQPSIDGVNTYFVSKMAAERGLKVVLSGVGGDELFGGYPTFQRIPTAVRLLKHMPTSAKHIGNLLYPHF